MTKDKTFNKRGLSPEQAREREYREYEPNFREHQNALENYRKAISGNDLLEQTTTAMTMLGTERQLENDQGHLDKIEKAYRQRVRTQLGTRATTSDVARQMVSTANYGIASQLAGSQGSFRIDQGISNIQARRAELSEELMNMSQVTLRNRTPGQKSKMDQGYTELTSLAISEGTAKQALAIHRRKGTDLASLHESTQSTLEQYRKEKNSQQLFASTGNKSIEKYDEQLTKLMKTFEELGEAVTNATTDTEKMSAEEKLARAKDEFDEASTQKKKFLESGGVGTRFQRLGAGLELAGAALTTGAGIYRQWNIGTEQDRVRLQTGAMDIANRRAFDRFNASQGDAEALGRLSGGQHSRSYDYAKKMGQKEEKASTAETVGAALTAGAAIIAGYGVKTAATGVGIKPGLAMIATAAVLAGSGHILNASGKAARLSSGAAKAEAENEAYNADEALFNAQNRYKAFINQSAINYTRDSTLATRGLGQIRGDVLKGIRNTDFQYAMAELEMDPAGILTATQAGGNLGRQFRGTADIRRGAELTKMNMMNSAEEYMGLRGQADRHGSGEKNLEAILSKAVAAGLDSSKHVNELVQGIDSMSTNRGGVSTFGGVAESMALTTQAFRASGKASGKASGMDAGQATLAAATLNSTLDDASGNQGVTIPQVQEYGEILQSIPNISPTTANKLTHMKMSEYRTVTDAFGTPNQENVKLQFGLGDLSNDEISNAFKISGVAAVKTIIKTGRELEYEKRYSDIMSGVERAPAVGSKEHDDLVNYWNATATGDQAKLNSSVSLSLLPNLFDSEVKSEIGSTAYYETDSPLDRYKAAIAKTKTKGIHDFRSGSDNLTAFGKYQLTKSTADSLPGFSHDRMVQLGDSEEGKVYQERMMDALIEEQRWEVRNIRKNYGFQASGYSDVQLTALVHRFGSEVASDYISKGKDESRKIDPFSPGIPSYLADFEKNADPFDTTLSSINDRGDLGSDILRNKAKGEVTPIEKGMEDLAKNVAIMAAAAGKISPDNFKTVIDQSSATLGGTLGQLDKSLKSLSDTVLLLNVAASSRLQKGSSEQEAPK